MKTSLKYYALAALLSLGAASASAADFFDTSEPESFFNLGVRLGVNTSNRTVDKKLFNHYNKSAWGTGFDAGIIANINIRNYISVQPGLFYECHSNDFTRISTLNVVTQENIFQWGHERTYDLTIPILAVVHLNVTDNLRWNLEAGPYVTLQLGSKNDAFYTGLTPDTKVEMSKANFGLKLGTGLNILDHYYFGVHYMAGLTSPWKNKIHGAAKAWTFTIGYDF